MQIQHTIAPSKSPQYLGLFLTSLTILMLEISLTRLLSVITWYYLAFFAVSTAILGITAGSVVVYLFPSWFDLHKLNKNLALASLGASIIIPLSLAMLLQIPATTSLLSLVTISFFSFLPFIGLGIIVSGMLTRSNLPIGKLYAADLAGAAMGSVLVLIGLENLSTPNVILSCGILSALGALCFSWTEGKSRLRTLNLLMVGVLTLALFLFSYPVNRLRPVTAKGKFENPHYFIEKWNSYSRVTVFSPEEIPPFFWSPSPLSPAGYKTFQSAIRIDSDAGTTIRKFTSMRDIEHLRYEGTNFAHFLRAHGTACIIGFGGGKDILGAILFGYEKVIGIDVNKIFTDLLTHEFRELAGIADYPGVQLVTDEARSYLARNKLDCQVIQMSLTDTWAATGAGAFSLSENSLYTTEAWQEFLHRLSDNGILTVSRWYNPQDLGETGRLISLAVATLLKEGIADPSSHLAMIRVNAVATLLVSKQPFTTQEILLIKDTASQLQYDLVLVPGIAPQNEILSAILSVESQLELAELSRKQFLNISPPTDENPYFFNQLRLTNISPGSLSAPGILQGNMRATINLVGLILSLSILALVTIIIPLLVKTTNHSLAQSGKSSLIAGGFYFSLIGAGFMLVEIALIQRFSVFLGHPIYSLAVILFTIVASAGFGSLASEGLPVDRKPLVYILPVVISGLIIIVSLAMRFVLPALSPAPMAGKIIVTILIILPLGFSLGFFFPMGMRIIRRNEDENSPWYWALNGIFGTLCSAVAVLISINFGIPLNFYLAGLCYLLLLLPMRVLTSHKRGERELTLDKTATLM